MPGLPGNNRVLRNYVIRTVVGRVDIEGDESLLEGVEAAIRPYETPTYCRCEQHQVEPQCGVALDVDRCDLQRGQ